MQELYLKLQNLKRTDKSSLFLIAVLALCMAIKTVAIDPLQNKIELSKNILAEETQRLENYRSFAIENNNYDAFIKGQNAAMEEAHKILPEKITAAELIKKYTEIAGKNNLQVESIKPVKNEKQNKKAYETITFKIILNGSFYKTAAFLDEIQNKKQLLTVNNVIIERISDSFNGNVRLTADLTAYALSD